MKGKIKIQFSKKSFIFWAVMAVILIIDLVTKYYAKLNNWNDIIIIKGVLEIGYTYNTGMAFSFLSNNTAFLIVFSVIMIVVIVVLLLFIPERFTILKLSLYMILGGAIGNLVDRIAYGYVRDFIWMVITNATCNVADIFIVVGTILAIIDLLFLNEWAAFPLTKKSKAIQAEKKKREKEHSDGNMPELTENKQENSQEILNDNIQDNTEQGGSEREE